MKVVLPVLLNANPNIQRERPVWVLLAMKASSHAELATHELEVFHYGRPRMLYTGIPANFLLLTKDELKQMDISRLFVIFITSAKLAGNSVDSLPFPSSVEGDCLVGRLSVDLLLRIWISTKSWSLGETSDFYAGVDLEPCHLKPILYEGVTPAFGLACTHGVLLDKDTLKPLCALISAIELGVTEGSPDESCAYTGNPSNSLPNLFRLRSGNVIFNYRQLDSKLLTSEVTEDFSCPFCLMKCANFKGLKCHLSASHDLLKFECLVTEEHQYINVYLNFKTWSPEIVGHGVNIRKQPFFFCSKSLRRRRLRNVVQNAKQIRTHVLDLNMHKEVTEHKCNANDGTDKRADPDYVQTEPGSCPPTKGLQHNNAFCGQDSYDAPDFVQPESVLQTPPSVELQHANTGKVASVNHDSNNLKLLQEGKFFHSRTAQPMTLEEVLSDYDSEDDTDYDIEDIEDQRMFSEFTDVSKDAKHMMLLWNSFVRRNRVRFGCHIKWACEAFTKLHIRLFIQAPMVLWWWRLFTIKLWNHGLLDAKTINTCNVIILQDQELHSSGLKS
ncbi:hypothetical protein DM860_002080 [Cuscuta australis]|uniref:Uncharacterized protein n=1 Tax=Cuscuta australis TaxID=267555 RepID=A0A328DZL1_9ASTE|nr:hypothetical protein DM860_002080 [Cuscuta australis]